MYEFISRTPILLNGYLLGLTHSCKMLKYGQTYFENLAFSTLFSRLCSCHVTYAFQSESTIYSCLNVKDFLSPRRCQISRLSNCNWTCTQNHLVLKRTLNHSVCPNSCVFLYELSGSGFESTCIHSALTFWHASSKEFLDIEATRECGFTLKTRT